MPVLMEAAGKISVPPAMRLTGWLVPLVSVLMVNALLSTTDTAPPVTAMLGNALPDCVNDTSPEPELTTTPLPALTAPPVCETPPGAFSATVPSALILVVRPRLVAELRVMLPPLRLVLGNGGPPTAPTLKVILPLPLAMGAPGSSMVPVVVRVRAVLKGCVMLVTIMPPLLASLTLILPPVRLQVDAWLDAAPRLMSAVPALMVVTTPLITPAAA